MTRIDSVRAATGSAKDSVLHAAESKRWRRMDAAQQEATARARELQRNWYGEPLGALFRRLIDDLGLNQARRRGCSACPRRCCRS
ncbi:hypothetical protein STENM223S_01180 [Streptomyces tendae]